MIAPHEVQYAERLKEINEQFGFEDVDLAENGFDAQFLKARAIEAEPAVETFAPALDAGIAEDLNTIAASDFGEFAIVGASPLPGDGHETVSEFADESDESTLLR